MKTAIALLGALSLCGCNLCGCNQSLTKDEQLELNKPLKISESGGATIWKVRDSTPGSKVYIYYSTPSGHVLAEDSAE